MIQEDEQSSPFLMFNTGSHAIAFVLPPVQPVALRHLAVDTFRKGDKIYTLRRRNRNWKITNSRRQALMGAYEVCPLEDKRIEHLQHMENSAKAAGGS